ncbi:PREDICTED: uncharacterized protein LOC108554524 [Eufriesea mexicana]|uniref:uncharacterized protein LOC108554524 n=1 Tax=Eufriesea mexicana TaxID=516756 RepID=UPI00083C587E|nr:PREDICTED: uncharacterized protein LOC108554524 [Eufriesea mexicana]
MEDEPWDTCFGTGNVAGAVIGTFLTTILLLLVAALLYRQWRRHKGKHLVLVTDPEIVEEAYAFDNPCFKDVTTSSTSRTREGAVSLTPGDTPGKDSARWSTSWTSLGLGSTNRNDKRKTLDDSCLGPKATRINLVSLKSRDFTGLGFNICGNMREGIFVKDLLHRGPASESGRIHPGDRIASVKISFRNMVYEDALTILSYASPYDVKLEVESGGIGSKPTTLFKKSVGPSAARICHPLYRSQSIPELSQSKSVAKRLFIVDSNESISSNYSTMNSTLKSSKSTPNSQTFEKSHDESKSNHHKFGIKVLPSLDGTVHRIENQNEHNTNLERRHSKKLDTEKYLSNMNKAPVLSDKKEEAQRQQTSHVLPGTKEKNDIFNPRNVDTLDRSGKVNDASIHVPSEVPTEVHNAAMAARRNRKNSSELLNTPKNIESVETEDSKNQQKNKRKAPPPPKSNNYDVEYISPVKKDSPITKAYDSKKEDEINSITDYTESLSEYIKKVRETTEKVDPRVEQKVETLIIDGRHSESDTDSEIQNSFTTIELNSADITIHRTPVPETNDDEDEEDDVYRKAASLGDLSKYECRTSATLERAQSLDMTDTGTKKRKAPLPPEDINESTEDLTKLDQIDTFDRRLLKKSNEWGNLEDVVWRKKQDSEEKSKKSKVRKKSNGSLERSKSAVEIKLKSEASESKEENFTDDETSIELYNLPLSKRLTEEFIRAERMFNPDEDNSLIRIVNDGHVVKSPTLEEVELQFKKETSLPDDFNNDSMIVNEQFSDDEEKVLNKDFGKALKHFETYTQKLPTFSDSSKQDLFRFKNWKEDNSLTSNEMISYAGKKVVEEEPMIKLNIKRGCHACDENCNRHETCKKKSFSTKRSSTPIPLQDYSSNSMEGNDSMTTNDDEEPNSMSHMHGSMFKDRESRSEKSSISSKSPSRRVIEVPMNQRIDRENDEDEDEYEFGSGVTINNKSLFDREDRRNINNISVSSGENSEDSGLVGESMDYNPQDFDNRPPLPNTPMPQKMTYITEIKLSANRGKFQEDDNENSETLSTVESKGKKSVQSEIKTTSNGKAASNKKPPVPPRRTDITKSSKKGNSDKQVIYVSEYKSNESKEQEGSDVSHEIKQSDNWSAET